MEPESQTGPLVEGRYQVRAVLGGGASSIVYLAHQTRVQREVAIKVIRPEVFVNERELERYLREVQIIAKLKHPNIVTLFDVGRLPDERPYMVMEFVAGDSLNRLVKHGGFLSVDTAFQVFEQVARGLAHAHRNGIVHRDIKPGNILLEHRHTGYPLVKVADFGVASQGGSSLTQQGAFIGTPMYMSPEQAQGQPVSPQSDLYSLGVVMYRVLTGIRPFEAETPVALAMCHVTEAVRPLREAAPHLGIPVELERVVLKCMEKDPADRYASADDLLTDLAEIRARILTHLLGLSQESLDGFRLRPPSPSRALLAARLGAAVSVLAAVGVIAFATGWVLNGWFTP